MFTFELQFKESLDRDQISKIWLQERTATVFAPTNEAFERASNAAKSSQHVAPYHIGEFHFDSRNLEVRVSTSTLNYFGLESRFEWQGCNRPLHVLLIIVIRVIVGLVECVAGWIESKRNVSPRRLAKGRRVSSCNREE